MSRSSGRELDLVLYGATGFTGRLVVEYLSRLPEGRHGLQWAIAGRDAQKLKRVAEEAGAPSATPILVADAADRPALAALAARTRVVLTTAGPYQLHGAPLLAACAANGTDYVDLCGEPAWMRSMIDAQEEVARSTGARIVFSCGFDSIPFDLGVWYLQEMARDCFGSPCRQVDALILKMKGPLSGGTLASLKATLTACQDEAVAALMRDPFALTPGFAGPAQPADDRPRIDDRLGVWLAPFLMAPINSKNIHRSNLLLGHAYGRDFRYSEMLVAGGGERGERIAHAVASARPFERADAPRPGEGPSAEERASGHYEALFIGATGDGRTIRARVLGNRDPGYGSTSMMITQSALCLLRDDIDCGGGIWTPAAALAPCLLGRLTGFAELTFAGEAD